MNRHETHYCRQARILSFIFHIMRILSNREETLENSINARMNESHAFSLTLRSASSYN